MHPSWPPEHIPQNKAKHSGECDCQPKHAVILVPRRWPLTTGVLLPCVFHVTVIVIIIPSGVLLNIRHLIIRHSLKNVFNNKLIMLPCLNDINKKRNFRVSNHHNKDLVHKQVVIKIISRAK